MNPKIQRFLPPVLVFGVATYCGWPPSEPLDLGDDLVKAKAVRWHKDELAELPLVSVDKDPFEAVLIASQAPQPETVAAVIVAAPEPAGPTPEMIQNELVLEGIARVAGRPWAIINGRPRLSGDMILTDGAQSLTCEIVSVQADHVVVRCQKTLASVRPLPAGSRREKAARKASDQPLAESDSAPVQAAAPPTDAPPPQA